jgi:predicted amidophosphoribosyltransferase
MVGKRGIPLIEIKENPDNVPLFADNLVDFLDNALGGDNMKNGGWCICTAPRRRHKDGFHFATAICKAVAKSLHIPFYEDAFSAKNRSRIDPEFYMLKNPVEPNVILYDDIITTGETMRAMRKLLADAGHVTFLIVAIKNVTMKSEGGDDNGSRTPAEGN